MKFFIDFQLPNSFAHSFFFVYDALFLLFWVDFCRILISDGLCLNSEFVVHCSLFSKGGSFFIFFEVCVSRNWNSRVSSFFMYILVHKLFEICDQLCLSSNFVGLFVTTYLMILIVLERQKYSRLSRFFSCIWIHEFSKLCVIDSNWAQILCIHWWRPI